MLTVEHVRLDRVRPNPWNPNRQTDRQYEAELGSLRQFGVVAPIVVRPDPDQDGWFEIVDGEHRVRALTELGLSDLTGAHPQLVEIVQGGVVPAVVLDLSDVAARQLTVVLNETRGRADPFAFGELLHELANLGVPPVDLTVVLPFTVGELENLMSIPNVSWDDHGHPERGRSWATGVSESVTVVTLSMDTVLWERWQKVCDALGEPVLPDDGRVNARVVSVLCDVWEANR